MELITVRGTEYETGTQLGAHFSRAIRECGETGARYLADAEISADYRAVKARLEARYPQYLQHLYGRADGAGADRDAYTLYVCAEVYEYRDHCTDIMVKTPGGGILGHNEDGAYTVDNAALVRYETDCGMFCDFTAVDALAGSSFTVNEHGLVFSMNYMHMQSVDQTGTPVWFVLRDAVCADGMEALIERLSAGGYASGFSINAADRKSGRLCSIEGKRGRLSVIDVEDVFVHTNHYLHPCFDENYSFDESNTLFRLYKSRELLGRVKGIPDEAQINNVLNYSRESYYNSIKTTPAMGKNVTACTFMYNMETGIVTVQNHLLNSVLRLNLDRL